MTLTSNSGLLAILYLCNFAWYMQALVLVTQVGKELVRFRTWCLLCLFLWTEVLKCTIWAQAGCYRSCGVWQKQFAWRNGFKGFCVDSCTCGRCLWVWTQDLNKRWCCDCPCIRRQLYVQCLFVQIQFSSSLPVFAVAMGRDKPLSLVLGNTAWWEAPFLRGFRPCRQSAREAEKIERERTKSVQSKLMSLIAVSLIIWFWGQCEGCVSHCDALLQVMLPYGVVLWPLILFHVLLRNILIHVLLFGMNIFDLMLHSGLWVSPLKASRKSLPGVQVGGSTAPARTLSQPWGRAGQAARYIPASEGEHSPGCSCSTCSKKSRSTCSEHAPAGLCCLCLCHWSPTRGLELFNGTRKAASASDAHFHSSCLSLLLKRPQLWGQLTFFWCN